MVDLVKIRKKKAAEKHAQAHAAPERTAEAEPAVSEAPAPPEPSPIPPAAQGAGIASAAGEDAGAKPSLLERALAGTPPPSRLERFKAEAGKRRESQSGQQEQESEAQIELLTFVIAGEQYAVDIERIVEIVTPRPVTRIPNAEASVVGIISLRGTIVTLVDVRRKLRHNTAAAEPTEDTRIVVIDFHHEVIGFEVDLVQRVVKTTAGDIEPHPVVHADELDEWIRGVFRAGSALTILLDLDKLLGHSALATPTA